ncbi:hypothetical protein [Blastococcus sp. CT_GayMR16]|uniref:hypothetical protein n=1 Tax=Blastococcus sp. CT_GayMR16 TaxID=2559607 RepID=UPI001072F498|nr:hypothetical protein [Blastococcus sp. CT_GayMR16]TFV83171.1 hypothetical protein E4P38_21175 [Blastococcus sp. CT_GayMR16]
MSDADLWPLIAERMDNPIVFGLVVAMAFYLFLSKRLAELKGGFAWVGALARWWTRRQERRIERDQALWRARYGAELERDAAELEQLRDDVEWLRRELSDMRRREQLRDNQARKHTTWDNEWVPKAQRAGLDIPEPPPLYLDLAPLFVPEEAP